MKRWLKGALLKMGYRLESARRPPRQLLQSSLARHLEFEDVITRRMFERGKNLTFIQVGVFDGITGDPLRKYIDRCGWRGIMVEPQRGAAEGLQKLYAGNPDVT